MSPLLSSRDNLFGNSPALAICIAVLLIFGNAVTALATPVAFRAQQTAKKSRLKKTVSNAKRHVDASPAPVERDESEPDASSQKRNARGASGEPYLVKTATERQQQTPAQRDATRPPGTERQQPVPTPARPAPQDPTAPPGTERPAPQSPPGTREPSAAPRTPTPSVSPSPSERDEPTAAATPAETLEQEEMAEPAYPKVEARPVPPMPSLTRVGVASTDPVPLSLDEAIRRALENNNEIEIARDDVRLAEAQLRSLQGVYDPLFNYTPEVSNSVRPVANIFGGAGQSGTVSTTDFNNDFSVTKQFARGGGNYTYFFNNTRQKTTATNTTLNPFYSSSQGVTFTQPLWRNRAIDRSRQQIRIQRVRLEQSDADFRRRTIDVIAQVQRAYWDLVFALRDEQNQIANLELARQNFRRTEASVAAGAVAPLQRAEVQTELSNRESALLLATQNVTVAENNLKFLLIKDPLSPDWSKVLVPTDTPSFNLTPVSLEDALKEARTNRQELRRLKLQEDINQIDLSYFENQTKPQINLTGTLSTTGLAGTPNTSGGSVGQIPLISGDPNASATAFLLREINTLRANALLAPVTPPLITPQTATIPSQFVGGYGQTLQNLFSFDTRNVVVGVAIQLPWKNRTAEANLAFARIQRDQLAAQTRTQEQAIEVEVRNAVQAVETARRRVLAARQARESAEEQLEGERRLYQVGRSTTFLLFQRENALVNARNQELRAETDYNKALAELQRVTSTTLRANNVIVETPVVPEWNRE